MKYLKIISPVTPPEGAYGILKDDTVHLLDRSPLEKGAGETGVSCRITEVQRFLPPVEPPNVFALGLNYARHAAESGSELPKAPVIFLKATTALTGHLQPVILPSEAPSEVDYEAELAVVIGKTARHIPEAGVFDHIFGYTCMNDVSARDCQRRLDKQWARAKSFDSFAPMGPVVETELDPTDLKVHSRLNGKTMQDGSTSDLIFSVPQIVSYLSRQFTLLPGTLISTGTPSGVGFARNPPVFLKAGDSVEIEVEGIGVLENPVVEEGIRLE
jgi:2-keto-4-pentenoate hydratase/2-oxohepta-3-ene-1,7-dioic acid hydratase in catechol pathway